MVSRRRVGRWLLRAFYVASVILLFAPLAIVALMGLEDAAFVGFPVAKLTLKWYGALLEDAELQGAFLLTLRVAAATMLLALPIGIWTALALDRLPNGGARALLLSGAILPLATPGIVMAIAQRVAIRVLGIEPGALAIILSHVVQAVPFVTILVRARHRTLPRELVDAAAVMGANGRQIIQYVILPHLRPAILAAGAIAFLLSFDEFVRAFFLGGYQVTLPVMIYGRLNTGLSPETNVAATVILVMALACGWLMDRFRRSSAADAD